MTSPPGVENEGGAVRLRPMRWWDLEPVQVLETELFPDAWSPETFWSELAGVPQTRHYLVAEAGPAIVGYAGLAVVGHQADVQTLAVAPAARGRGVGGRLLDELIAEARRRSAGEVLLEVRPGNEAALALYAGRGFEQIAVRRGYFAPDGADAHVLRLRLGDTP